MREILFRGKRKDNGEWVFGMPWIFKDHACVCPWHEGMCKYDTGFYPVHVDPETVGQFTGLSDKNGKKIFEGDIVTFRTSTSTFKPLYVRWHYETARFLVTTADCIRSYPMDEVWQYEIIGNIHDHPELLEVSK